MPGHLGLERHGGVLHRRMHHAAHEVHIGDPQPARLGDPQPGEGAEQDPGAVAGFYPKGADALNQVQVGRFLPADKWFMHPRRWNWMMAAADNQGRPLVLPEANGRRTRWRRRWAP